MCQDFYEMEEEFIDAVERENIKAVLKMIDKYGARPIAGLIHSYADDFWKHPDKSAREGFSWIGFSKGGAIVAAWDEQGRVSVYQSTVDECKADKVFSETEARGEES